MALLEQEAKESIDRPELGMVEFRRNLEYVLSMKEIDAAEFLESLILPEDAQAKQARFFQDTQDLKFINDNIGMFDQLGERNQYILDDPYYLSSIGSSIDSTQTLQETKDSRNLFLSHLLAIRTREEFLQRQLK